MLDQPEVAEQTKVQDSLHPPQSETIFLLVDFTWIFFTKMEPLLYS